ncbi:MAG TPA: hypothetical protein VKB38_00210 [Terracidiphilus sp.]|nr:hypothetical protein [Terracidiphilus sp.]
MKRIPAIIIVLLASLAAAGSAAAQDHQTKAIIPFNFYVDNTWMPSGTYTLSSDSNHAGLITVANADWNNAVVVETLPDDARAGSGKLVFHKVGDQYFLHEILASSSHMNAKFFASRTEKSALTRESAANDSPSTVYLALLK